MACFLILVTSCSDGEPGPSELDEGPWRLVWSDEFDGDRVDESKWEFQSGDGCPGVCGWGNNELQWYHPRNATINDGLLVIEAREEEIGGKQYSSARMRTRGKGDWTYGRFEIRARLPQGQGIWPAIWMMPTDSEYGGWAASGEIDIMELVGHRPSTVHGTIHYGASYPNNRHTGSSFDLAEGVFHDDFHVFAMEWKEGLLRWFVDDSLYFTLTEWSTTGAPFPAPFDRRFHLILNVAVGGNWPGDPDPTTQFPQRMEVDYVRVYESVE